MAVRRSSTNGREMQGEAPPMGEIELSTLRWRKIEEKELHVI